MTSINVSQNLRPLKFAYVIKPGDFGSLERIISLNSFLWGGAIQSDPTIIQADTEAAP